MKAALCTTVLAASTLVASAARAAEAGRSLAGWYDLFPPSQDRLYPMYERPINERRPRGEIAYRQTVRFDAMTSLPRSFHVTVARNPDFKTQYRHEALMEAPAKTQEIAKRSAWVWNDKKKVVVPLGADTAVIIETDTHSEPMPVVEYAKSLDYNRIETALAKLPRTGFTPTLETFRAFKKGDSAIGDDWSGPAQSHEQVGAKEDERMRWTYSLKDGSKILVTAAGGKIEAVSQSKDGHTLDLLK